MLEARRGCDASAAGPLSQRRSVKDGGVAILPTEYGSKFGDFTRQLQFHQLWAAQDDRGRDSRIFLPQERFDGIDILAIEF